MTAYRTQANTGTDVLVSTHTITTPGTVVSGDYGVFWLTRWDSGASFPTVTAPSGAVLRGTVATSQTLQIACFLIKTAGEASFTFSWTGARWSNLSVQFFSGVDPSLTLSTVPFDSAIGTTATTITTLNVTTVNTAALSFCVNTLDYPSSTTHGPPTGFTETADVDGFTNAYFISTSTGTVSAAGATVSPAQSDWAAALVALAPASGGSTPISDSDTGAGTDTESVAATNSDSDVGTGSEGTPIIGVSDSDISTGVDTESTVQGAADSDTPTGTDSQSLAATLSDSDTNSGADTESVTASVSDSDTSAGTDTESTVQGATGSETNAGTDTESLAATLSDSDTSTEADTESITASVSDSDTSSGTDTESVSQGGSSISDGDAPSGTDSQSITANTSDADTSTGADTEAVAAASSDSDLSGGTETFALNVQVSDSDLSNVTDSATASIVATTTPGDSDNPSASESWFISVLNASVPERSLVMGPASLYIAAYGAVEPSNGAVGSAPDPLVWTDLGGILGGVNLTVEQEWVEIQLKQLIETPMRRVKKRRLSIKTQLAEPTLTNLAFALNDSAPVSGAFEPTARSDASQLTYNALIVDGWAPGYNPGGQHKRRRIIIRKALSIDNVDLQYSKDGQTLYTVTWSCHYVSGTVAPFRVIDQA